MTVAVRYHSEKDTILAGFSDAGMGSRTTACRFVDEKTSDRPTLLKPGGMSVERVGTLVVKPVRAPVNPAPDESAAVVPLVSSNFQWRARPACRLIVGASGAVSGAASGDGAHFHRQIRGRPSGGRSIGPSAAVSRAGATSGPASAASAGAALSRSGTPPSPIDVNAAKVMGTRVLPRPS